MKILHPFFQYFTAMLFNLWDGTQWCGWENPVVRMTNTVQIRKLCCVVDKHSADKNRQTSINIRDNKTPELRFGENILCLLFSQLFLQPEMFAGFSLRVVENWWL